MTARIPLWPLSVRSGHMSYLSTWIYYLEISYRHGCCNAFIKTAFGNSNTNCQRHFANVLFSDTSYYKKRKEGRKPSIKTNLQLWINAACSSLTWCYTRCQSLFISKENQHHGSSVSFEVADLRSSQKHDIRNSFSSCCNHTQGCAREDERIVALTRYKCLSVVLYRSKGRSRCENASALSVFVSLFFFFDCLIEQLLVWQVKA